ncbi:MAG: PAS domain S-box protein [Anaerolineae bacterium]|nr:PAS domain S-box protein [Anaerolineae bacterium]
MINPKRLPCWLVMLIYVIALTLSSWLIVRFSLPDSLLFIFVVPCVLLAFFYGRRVYLPMIISLFVASIWVTYLVSMSFVTSLTTIVVAALSGLAMAEIVRALMLARERAEIALQQNRERLELALEGAGEGMWDLETQTGRLYLSPRSCTMLGFEPDEVESNVQWWAERIHPQDVERVRSAVQAHLEGQTAHYETEHRVKTKSGEWKWVMDRGKVVERDEQGRPLREMGIHLDLTDRKEAEAALYESEERYQNFVSQIFEGIYRTEFDNPIDITLPVETQIDLIYENAYMAECNQALAEMYNLPSGESLIGARLIDAHGGKDDPTNRATFRRLIENGYKSVNDETLEYTDDGQPVWFLSNTIGIVKDGYLIRLWGTAIVINERKQAEEALRASEARYRNLVEQSLQGMVIAQDNPVRLAFASRPMQAITGFSPQELTSFGPRQLVELIHPQDREAFFANFRARLIGEPVPPRHEYRVIHKSGEVRWVEIYSAQIEYEGTPATQTVFLDITARKQAEEALQISLEKYRVLFEAFPLGITISDEAGTILEVNRASERLLGLPAQEHGQRQIDGPEWQIIRPDGTPMPRETYASVRALAENRLVENVEMGVVKPGGDVIWLNVTAAPIPLEGYGVAVAYGDITERKRVEEALREREAYFRALFEHAGDAIFIEDEADRIIDVNRRACELLGYTREELLNMTVAQVQAPERRGRVGGIIQSELAKYDGQPFETLDLRQDGTRVPVEVTTVHLTADEETLALSIVRDISERIQAQRALRQERDLSRALADAAAAVSRTLDPDEVLDRLLEQVSRVIPNDATNIMLIDPDRRVYVARWRGYERFGIDAFVASLVYDLDQVPNLKRMAETGEPMVVSDTTTYPGWVHAPEQAWLRSYVGAPIYIRGAAVGFLCADSATPGFFTLLHADILRAFADHAAMALQNAQLYQERVRAERLLSALNRAALSIARATTTGEIFAAAAGELRALGLVCSVLMLDEAKSGLHLVHTDHETAEIEVLEALTGLDRSRFALSTQAIRDRWQGLSTGQAVLLENTREVLEPLLPEPARRWAGDIVRRLNMSGSILAALLVEARAIGLLVVQGDNLVQEDVPAITAFAHQVAAAWHKAELMQSLRDSLDELKRTQARLVQAQKMEAVGRLAGGIAHDFNNHLTAIQGYAEMVLLELDPQDPRRADVHEIQRAAQRSAELTRQLLAFSRKQVIQPRVLNLNNLIETMRNMLGRLIGEDIELHTALAPALDQVKADPGQIEQVVMNLAVNARDAIDEKVQAQAAPFAARLTIETANVELDEAYVHDHIEVDPGLYVMLAVSDNGIGLDEAAMSHLFEPFFTTKEQGKGTGLGLATVYGVVKQNGGYVFPYSEPGVGTTFKVYLPRIKPEANAQEPLRNSVPDRATAAVTSGSETILLVEDEEAVRALAQRVLVEHGYRVLEAANADDALRLCAQHSEPIHLVLTDVIVPGLLSSKEMVDRMMAVRPAIKVIYMSGYTDNVIAHHGVLDPGIQFVQKPFTPGALALKVRRVLDGYDAGDG